MTTAFHERLTRLEREVRRIDVELAEIRLERSPTSKHRHRRVKSGPIKASQDVVQRSAGSRVRSIVAERI